MGWFTRKRKDDEQPAFKALGGGWWYAIFTNAFIDRDGEILSEDAQEKYVRRVKAGMVPMPELWLHHTEGARIGQATYVDRVGKSTYALGKFDDNAVGKAAERYYKRHSNESALSHGFNYPIWARGADGVYKAFNTFEISVLPRGSESNPYTTFDVVKELNKMPVTPAAEKYIREVLGAQADTVLATLDEKETRDKALEDAGVKFKDFVDLPADETPEATKAEVPPTEDDEVDEELVTEEVTEEPAAEVEAEAEPVAEEAPEPEPETDKVDDEINSVLGQIVEGQGVLMEMLTALSERLNTVETEAAGRYEKAEARIKQLEGLLEVSKIKASEAAAADATPADDSAVEAEAKAAIQSKMGPGDFDPLFPGLKVRR